MDRPQDELVERFNEVVKLKENSRTTNVTFENARDKKQFKVCKLCAELFCKESNLAQKELVQLEEHLHSDQAKAEGYTCTTHLHSDQAKAEGYTCTTCTDGEL
jgi:hypothetical protein